MSTNGAKLEWLRGSVSGCGDVPPVGGLGQVNGCCMEMNSDLGFGDRSAEVCALCPSFQILK